jgi:hypothetical protein
MRALIGACDGGWLELAPARLAFRLRGLPSNASRRAADADRRRLANRSTVIPAFRRPTPASAPRRRRRDESDLNYWYNDIICTMLIWAILVVGVMSLAADSGARRVRSTPAANRTHRGRSR